jgi:D-threo-aldose 1-dehydrogenase
MKTIEISKSAIKITQIGFGCARLGSGIELPLSSGLIECALDHGIRHFDTAPMYGSEILLGEIFGDSKSITVTTKVGIDYQEDRSFKQLFFTPLYRYTARRALSYFPKVKARLHRRASTHSTNEVPKKYLDNEYILRQLDLSLKRLKRSKIDIYLIHEPNQFFITDENRELFQTLKDQGAIGEFGLAYGETSPIDATPFGKINQSAFRENLLSIDSKYDETNIFHGTLKLALNNEALKQHKIKVSQYFANIVNQHPKSAFLISASSQRNIRTILSSLNK